jgi:tetratricopeptide (TPR) repeat protein
VFFYFNRAQALTDKDTILLADFVNTTGESVFDGTLKQALAVQLGQTPFLNILPDERVRETLRFMGRSPDERITRDVGIEICQRQGIKALLIGSITSIGSHYVVSLEALNAQTGDSIARDQVEADSKEKVLSALSTSAWRLREKLGESLSMMHQFAVPIDQATTSSLDALKAYATGNELRAKGRQDESVAFYKRAVELDPNFAMAYARLAVYYGNRSERGTAQQYAQKAYDLRDRVSEHERYYISEKYHNYITGDIDKAIETLKAWVKTYPNDFVPHNNLALNYSYIGKHEESLKEQLEAVRIDPRNNTARGNLVEAFARLGRYDEAQQALKDLEALGTDNDNVHFFAYSLAYAKNDAAAVQREVDWARGKPAEGDVIATEAAKAAVQGKLEYTKELTRQAVSLFEKQDRKESAAMTLASLGQTLASVDRCKEGLAAVADGLAINRGRIPLTAAAGTYALCGDGARAQAIVDELLKTYPTDTGIVSIAVPGIKAEIERRKGRRAEALQLLESVRRYDLGTIAGFSNNYLRGLTYLDDGRPAEAAKEFQRIIEARSLDLYSQLYPLAQLGLARSLAKQGDLAKSRVAYQDFFAFWKDADRDLPLLQQAQKEYEALK